MKRLIILLAMLVAVAAACGGDATVTSDDQPADADPPTDADEQPPPDEPLGAGPYPIADLTISYEHPDVGTIAYQVVCLGDTATLIGDIAGVSDQAACLALADGDVQQRLIDGPPIDQVCTEIYGGPETARITGTIDEQPVDTTIDRANGCGIDDWDAILVDLLPPPRPFA